MANDNSANKVLAPLDVEQKIPSPLVEQFIHIIDPLCEGNKPLSRRFAAAMLLGLATAIRNSTSLPYNANKLLMMHAIISRALYLCPPEVPVYEELKKQLEILRKQGARAIDDHHKFSFSNQANHSSKTTHEQFRSIVQELVDEIEVVLKPDVEMDTVIELLLRGWLEQISSDTSESCVMITDKSVATLINSLNKHLPDLQLPLPTSDKEVMQPVPTKKMRSYSTLYAALVKGTSDELILHMDSLKKEKSPLAFLDKLISKKSGGYTLLHEAFTKGSTETAFTYLERVKLEMSVQKKSFADFLLSSTHVQKFTLLHLAAMNCNPEFVKSFDNYLQQELSEADYAYALTARTSKGFMPSGFRDSKDEAEINDYLTCKRKEYAPKAGNNGDSSYRFFDKEKTKHDSYQSSYKFSK